jgi:hypothetical protein
MSLDEQPQEHYEILGLYRGLATAEDVIEAVQRLVERVYPGNHVNDPSKWHALNIAFPLVRF